MSPKSREPESFGENVLPRLYFSAEGDRGGVWPCPFGLCGVLMLEIKIGDGGVSSAWPGF
jgi:hypothetical protein